VRMVDNEIESGSSRGACLGTHLHFHPVVKVTQGILEGIVCNRLVDIRFTDILVCHNLQPGVDKVDPALLSG